MNHFRNVRALRKKNLIVILKIGMHNTASNIIIMYYVHKNLSFGCDSF